MSTQPDILGAPWVNEIIPVAEHPAAPGADRAVLVYQEQAPTRADGAPLPGAVLYLPGFVDYFFQAHVAQAFIDSGIEFYGLDQRAQGRAIGSGGLENINDLGLRNVEIARAVRRLREIGHQHITLAGHSTGGLQAVIYAARATPGGPHASTPLAPPIDAVLLNSPWFSLHRRQPLKAIANAAALSLGGLAPDVGLGVLGPQYGRFLHRAYGGEWDFSEEWKVLDEMPARAGFLKSVFTLQAELRSGLGITVPILLCTSGKAGHPVDPTPEELASCDVVLNPADMWRLADRLGGDVTTRIFPGAAHDIALSRREVREDYLRTAVAWVAGQIGS